MRYYNLPIYNYKIKTTPFLDKIKNRCLIFTNAFCCTNATDPSLASLYTGKYPSRIGLIHHGVHIKTSELKSINKQVFLQKLLLQQGYLTIAIDILGRWHRKGFKYYIDPFELQTYKFIHKVARRIRRFTKIYNIATKLFRLFKGRTISKPNGKFITELALNFLNKYPGTKRFFMLIHYWDTHMPYKPPIYMVDNFYQKYKAKYSNVSKNADSVINYVLNRSWKRFLSSFFKLYGWEFAKALAAYDACLFYTDLCLKSLFEKLETLGLLDNTIIIITADHGESLYEHNIFFDHHGLYEVTVRVPLLIYDEGEGMRGYVHTPVQLVDLFPTILEICGLRRTLSLMRGLDGLPLSSLLDKVQEDRFLFFEEAHTERKIALRTRRAKYITALNPKDAICKYCGRIHGGLEELYNLEKDPSEKKNLVYEREEVKALLRKILLNKFRRLKGVKI